jgi:hypothetical protein
LSGSECDLFVNEPGEEDQDGYDINKLKKLVNGNIPGHGAVKDGMSESDTLPLRGPAADADVSEFIGQRLDAVNSDPSAPPYDSVREYAYEGAGSIVCSLSSVASTDENESEHFDELNNWGPRFLKLADVYGLRDT